MLYLRKERLQYQKGKGKGIPITGHEDPQGMRTQGSKYTQPRHQEKIGWLVLCSSPSLWARRQHARLSRSGPGFDSRQGQVSWVRFFRDFSSPVRQMSESFRPQGPRISFGHHYHHQSSFITGTNGTIYIHTPMLGCLYPREKLLVLMLQEVEWTPGPVWTQRSEENLHPSNTGD